MSFLDTINEQTDFSRTQERLTFEEYLVKVSENPLIVRNATQRVYDMVMSYGTRTVIKNKKEHTRYNFFDGNFKGNKDQIFGLEEPLEKLVKVLKAAAFSMGMEKRIILLHGPVGSSKSTIVRMLKKAFEEYTKSDEGAMYTFEWCLDDPETPEEDKVWEESQMRNEPLLLIPAEFREEFLKTLFSGKELRYPVDLTKELNPACNFNFMELQNRYNGDWKSVLRNHVRVKRLVASEKDRIGIGTFQPKDEKNQDSTELTGDINYRKIAIYGSDSDPRVFNFDGEFCKANRGIMEFVEMLKLDVAFLYDLLCAAQEHKIKPKKFSQVDIDQLIIGSTNEAELVKLEKDELMAALRDRITRIDIPYLLELDEEKKIYSRDFYVESPKMGGKFIAPHTVHVASMFAILTRLEKPNNGQMTAVQKLKLYNGKSVQSFTADNVADLKSEAEREGLEGISPRYIQDRIAESIVSGEFTTVNPFIVMNKIEEGLEHNTRINDDQKRTEYKKYLSMVKSEYESIIKQEVQRAISADEDALSRLFANYISNVSAYVNSSKIKNPYTGKEELPNERLMRDIESRIDINESHKDEYRRTIMSKIGSSSMSGETFSFESDERLKKALERKLFEDQKDSINLSRLLTTTIDRETQEKIDVVKNRLINNYGYDDESATDVLNYVSSIYARGEIKDS